MKVPPLNQIQRKPPVIRGTRSENRHGKQTQKSVETVSRNVNGRHRQCAGGSLEIIGPGNQQHTSRHGSHPGRPYGLRDLAAWCLLWRFALTNDFVVGTPAGPPSRSIANSSCFSDANVAVVVFHNHPDSLHHKNARPSGGRSNCGTIRSAAATPGFCCEAVAPVSSVRPGWPDPPHPLLIFLNIDNTRVVPLCDIPSY